MENFQKKIFLVKVFSLNKNLWQILTYKNKKAFYLFFVVFFFILGPVFKDIFSLWKTNLKALMHCTKWVIK